MKSNTLILISILFSTWIYYSNAHLGLRAILREVTTTIKNQDSKNFYIMAILDGSGSISSQTWQKMIQSVEKLFNTVSSNRVKFSILIFSTDVYTQLSDFNLSTDQLLKALKAFNQPNAYTYTGLALETANTIFNKINGEKIAIILTDGVYSDDPTVGVRQLKNQNVQLIGIGFGSGINLSTIEQISSPNNAFHIDDIQAIIQTLDQLQLPENQLYGMVDIVMIPEKESYYYDEEFTFQFTIKNMDDNNDVPAGTKVYFTDPTGLHFFDHVYTLDKKIKVRDNLSIKTKLSPLQAVASLESLPEIIAVKFVDPNRKEINCKYSGFTLRTDYFAKKLHENSAQIIKSSPTINIGVFGPTGSGKSTLINSFLTALNKEGKIDNRLRTLKSGDSVTLEINHVLEQNFKFIDTEGLSSSSWDTPQMLTQYLYGLLPDLHRIGDGPIHIDSITVNDTFKWNITHVVLFVIPHNYVELEPTSGMLTVIKEKVLSMSRLGFMVLCVVTHLEDITDFIRRKEILNQVSQKIGINEADIFPFSFKVEKNQRSFETDLHALMILERATTEALTSVKNLKFKLSNSKLKQVEWKDEL